MSPHSVEDIAFDENFEAYINERGDLAGWSGASRFEGHVTLRLTSLYRDIIGEHEQPTIKTKLQQEAGRVAQAMDEIESVSAIQVQFADDEPNTVKVTIIYNTTEEFSETIQP